MTGIAWLRCSLYSLTLMFFGLSAGVLSSTETRADESPSRINLAVQILLRVPSGKAEIEKALATWKISHPEDLDQVIKSGSVSRTDAVLTRHYDPDTGKESRDREVTIYLNTNQSLTNMVLDLAHEMVHATSRPAFDPYDPDLTRAQYIHTAIDGVGGEVQAVEMECRVAAELSKNYDIPLKRCKSYLDSKSGYGQDLTKGGAKNDAPIHVNAEAIRRDFYRVGKWNNELLQVLGAEASLLSELSPEVPQLYSSTGNAPYPVALLKEYEALTQIACENSRKRLATSNASAGTGSITGRAPASVGQDDPTSMFLQRRCH